MGHLPSLLYPINILKTIRDNFVKELTLSSQGKKTSLAFIKNPIPQKPLIEDNEIFQVIAIGGSIFEKALVCKKRGEIVILGQEEGELPLFKTKDLFFSFFENHLDHHVEVVALNFAFALEPELRNGILDGKLLGSSKEHQFDGLVGKFVGEELAEFVRNRYRKRVNIGVANDVICLTLAGLHENNWRSLVGGIIGTGMNFCCFLDENTAVNLESGNFNKFGNTATGKEIDKKSAEEGAYLFEKEVAGAYLFQHFNLLMEPLKLTGQSLNSTQELSNLAEKDIGDLSLVARKILERSASLAACQIAGIYRFLKRDQLTFVMEGTLFWNGWKYKEMVEGYLEKLAIPPDSVKFKYVKNSSILGGARIVIGRA